MVNGHSITHGGFVFALADTGFTVAGNSMAGPRWAGAAIAYVDSTSLGDELVAQAVERVRSGRSGIYDVRVGRGEAVLGEFRADSRELGAR
jgi:acyl-CoA thioesterase